MGCWLKAKTGQSITARARAFMAHLGRGIVARNGITGRDALSG